MDIPETDLQWLAGIVDSEGSIDLRYANAKRDGYQVQTRVARMRIKTCDLVIVPRVANWVGTNTSTKPQKNTNHTSYTTTTICGGRLRALLPMLIPHLYTKQPQASLVLEALNIKAGQATIYSASEAERWDNLYHQVATFNKDGVFAEPDTCARSHRFSWPWLAGFVDGDGTITASKFTRNYKPVLKISLAHLPTITYLAKQLGRGELSSGGGKGNKRPTRAIRLMSNDLLRVLPEIIPYLAIKKKQAELALEIVELRSRIPNGQHDHPNVARAKLLIRELNTLNAVSRKSRWQL